MVRSLAFTELLNAESYVHMSELEKKKETKKEENTANELRSQAAKMRKMEKKDLGEKQTKRNQRKKKRPFPTQQCPPTRSVFLTFRPPW